MIQSKDSMLCFLEKEKKYMSKKIQHKQNTAYSDDLMFIVCSLRCDLKALQDKYKNEMTECLKSVPLKVFDNQLRIKLLQTVPESLEFIASLSDNNCHVKQHILKLQPNKLDEIELNQHVINLFIENNINNIHSVPQAWRNEQTIAHFMNTYKNIQSVEIFEDLPSYKENLTDFDIEQLQQQFGILSFINNTTSDEVIMKALQINPYAFYSLPLHLQKEEFKLKVLEIEPQVLGTKPISLTDKLKDACLRIIASMNKVQAKHLINNSWKSILKTLKERDRKVHIVENWNFA